MNKIYFRNFLITASLVLVSFFAVGIAFVLLGRSFLISSKRDNMSASASEVVRAAYAFNQNGSFWDWELRVNISAVSRITGYHIFITNADGEIILCSDMQIICEHFAVKMPEPVMAALRTYGEYNHLSNLDGFYTDMHYVVALPITSEQSGDVSGYVFVSSNSGTLMDAWKTFLMVFAMVAGFVIVLAMALSYVASVRMARPIGEMTVGARRFAHGDFSVRVVDEGREDDIGELIAAFNAMAESLEKAEERRRDFIANVSHELKTPMTTIAGFADGILDGTIEKASQDRYLAIISSETKRLSRLVRNMLELSRFQAVDPKTLKEKSFDISEVLRRTLLGLEHKITGKGLDVEAQLPEESMVVLGDEDGITQVAYNLLDNAIKFSIPGGVLTLTLWKQSGKAYVSVKNQGETIPEGELPVIFERFHKTDRSRSRDREGVGLGLYIVKAIIGNHDEDIFVRSQNSETEFVFTLTLKQLKEPNQKN